MLVHRLVVTVPAFVVRCFLDRAGSCDQAADDQHDDAGGDEAGGVRRYLEQPADHGAILTRISRRVMRSVGHGHSSG